MAAEDSLNDLLKSLGVTPTGPAAAPAGQPTYRSPMTAEPQWDVPVFAGTRSTRTPPRDAGRTPSRTVQQDVLNNVEGELSRWYKMTPEQRAQTQYAMFLGGAYPSSVNADEIRWGDPDDDGFKAWTSVVNRAARSFASGERVTVDDVLSNMASIGAMAAERTASRSGGGGGGGGGGRVSVSSALELSRMANNTAQQVLGRKATQEEQRIIIAAVQQAQTSFQVGRGGEIPAPEAIAEQTLTSGSPLEAQGKQYADTFGTFMRLLGGIGA